MSVPPTALVAIVTYATRAGGHCILDLITLSSRTAARLAYHSGAVLTSLVVPSVLEEGMRGVIALAATGLATWWRGNLLLASGPYGWQG